MKPRTFESVDAMIAAMEPSYTVYCIQPDVLRGAVSMVLDAPTAETMTQRGPKA
tara:strand:- start:1465 stop:1626 length:162 start_codon:yes stop_codon:yes gene_type:complete